MGVTSREIHLVRRPRGAPEPADFALVERDLGEPPEGQVLIRNAFLSVDPYMRGRMNDARSYVPPDGLDEPLGGGAVGTIEASRHPDWPEGTWVLHYQGWRERALSDGRGLRAVDPGLAPPSTALGVLGMPGLTAYVGLLDIGRVQPGETVFVSGAAGAVGSAAGQIARHLGCRVIGSAGSPEKVAWLEELGFDVAFDYRSTPAREALAEGLDVYFDNVGGSTLEAAIGALRLRGRVVACGSISLYNATEAQPGPRNMFQVVTKRLRLEGFIVSDHDDRLPDFLRDMAGWVRDGVVRYRETVVDGIENAPDAFIDLLQGGNVGKMLVRVDPGA